MVSVLIVLAVVGGTFVLIRGYLGDRQKRLMLSTVDSMELSGSERQEVRRLMETVHQSALESAVARSTASGEETIMQAYAAEVFQRIIARAGDAGNQDLAEKLTREQGQFEF